MWSTSERFETKRCIKALYKYSPFPFPFFTVYSAYQLSVSFLQIYYVCKRSLALPYWPPTSLGHLRWGNALSYTLEVWKQRSFAFHCTLTAGSPWWPCIVYFTFLHLTLLFYKLSAELPAEFIDISEVPYSVDGRCARRHWLTVVKRISRTVAGEISCTHSITDHTRGYH